jgi:hypothetical protein
MEVIMDQYDLNASLRKSIARKDAYDRCERFVMWACAAIIVAVIAWKAYQAIAVRIAGTFA